MNDSPIVLARRTLVDAVELLRAASDSSACDDDVLSAVVACEEIGRALDHLSVIRVADLDRRGTFAARGYARIAAGLADLVGWDHREAGRRVRAADAVAPRVGLDGQVLPARLAAIAGVFAVGATSLRHVETIARELGTPAADRLAPEAWAGVEAELADKAPLYTPAELGQYARALISGLDQDGAEPDDRNPVQVNALTLRPRADGTGGTVAGDLDAVGFETVATAIGALTTPRTGDEDRPLAARQADALVELCGHALDHGDGLLPTTSGERPHLNVIIRLEDLEARARSALLDFGGRLSPEEVRMAACDARVVPVVLGGNGQPLDVGRAMRTVPDGLRRAVAARDRGCAHPGCDRPPSWSEIHHIAPWEQGGPTELGNLVMLCRQHHRLIHKPGWTVRIRDGLPEFYPSEMVGHSPAATPTTRTSRGLTAVQGTGAANRGHRAVRSPRSTLTRGASGGRPAARRTHRRCTVGRGRAGRHRADPSE